MLKQSIVLLAGLASVRALGQHQCLYRTDEGEQVKDHLNQVVFDRHQSTDNDDFTLISADSSFKPGISNPVLTSSKDNVAVHLAVAAWVEDLRKVTGVKLDIYNDTLPEGAPQAIIVGTSESDLIQSLHGYSDVRDGLKGKWESFDIRVLEKPLQGLEKAAVISGSDRVSDLYTGSVVERGLIWSARHGVRPLRLVGTSWCLTLALVVRFSSRLFAQRQVQRLDPLLSRRAIRQIPRSVHQR